MANNHNNIQSDEQKQYFKDRAGTDEARFHVVPHDEEGWAVKRKAKTSLSTLQIRSQMLSKKQSAWLNKPAQWPFCIMRMEKLKIC